MKYRFGLVLGLAFCCIQTLVFAAQPDEEQRLIDVLQSDASPAQKDAACARLKFIGTARSVPALGALLTDEQLSHSARYALEFMPVEGAGDALLSALEKTTGLTCAGIINSLAARREARAVPILSGFLLGQDINVGAASARALGQLGGPEARAALQNLRRNSAGPVHDAAVDGLLRCANRSLGAGDSRVAQALFQELYDGEKADGIRLAAYEGLIRAYGDRGVDLMTRAITGPAGPAQKAALHLVRNFQPRDATEALSKLLPRVQPPVQIALIEGLSQRGDPAAATHIAALLGRTAPEVNVPILNALGNLGDASTVALLSPFAATGTPTEREAAREGLRRLRRGPVTETLLAQMPNAIPAVQSELARALGDRGDRAAIPTLLQLASQQPDTVRRSAMAALAMLAEQSELVPMVELVVQADGVPARLQAAEALNTACQRIQARRGSLNAEPLLEALAVGTPEARAALLPICSGLRTRESRLTLRTALTDTNPEVRNAAVRALCDSVDLELVDDMVDIAHTTKDESLRTLAIGGGVRLMSQEESPGLSRGRRVSVLRALMAAAARPEQKRMVLSGLAEVPDFDALTTVEPALDDPAVQTEAARAAVQIAVGLPSKQAQETIAVLKKAQGVNDPATQQAVEKALQQIEASADYITDWLVAGPYRQEGKDFAALFDVVFPPELEDPHGVNWQPLAAGSDPKRPFVMDLLKALGGEQCVAYARTWVISDKDQPALLELGSDDGIKVWLNDKQVFALNTARPLQPGSDKVNVSLHSGLNQLLLKITQNNQGWEFCARLLKPDGTHLEGVRCESVTRTASTEPPKQPVLESKADEAGK